jgi:mannose-1-phosphate guanylyltransferase
VILADGDGETAPSGRGGNRPRQFCRFEGGRTLLAKTKQRIARCVPAKQTVLVLTEHHKSFYANEIQGIPAHRLIVQPGNRGSLPAILWSLLRVTQLDEAAVVGFFPADHHYSDEGRFVGAVADALAIVQLGAFRDSVVILGAPAQRPATDYGWIEPEPALLGCSGGVVRRVRRFWERPSEEDARSLLNEHWLWNTFVMVGRAAVFLTMIGETEPELYAAMRAAEFPYDQIPTADFSTQVLSVSTQRLTVLPVPDVGWRDFADTGLGPEFQRIHFRYSSKECSSST